MDAKERLRLYLEQRRDLGESELVLDSMSVDEVMRAIGAIGKGVTSSASGPGNWREVLSAEGTISEIGTKAATNEIVSQSVAIEIPGQETLNSIAAEIEGC